MPCDATADPTPAPARPWTPTLTNVRLYCIHATMVMRTLSPDSSLSVRLYTRARAFLPLDPVGGVFSSRGAGKDAKKRNNNKIAQHGGLPHKGRTALRRKSGEEALLSTCT